MSDTTNGSGRVPGIKAAIGSVVNVSDVSPTATKVKLAFFLVSIAALMVFVWMFCVFGLKATVDAGMAALLASFVTSFIKMASDASGYQYSSSAGSDKKDETTAKATEKMVEKIAPASPPPPAAPPTQGPPWWDQLTPEEKTAIEAAAKADPVIEKFIATAKAGWASKADLVYLVSKKLLTDERTKQFGG